MMTVKPNLLKCMAPILLLKKFMFFGGINRSITDSITNKKTTGIAYESCCWALRVEYFKNHIDGNNYDNVTNFELVLKGL